MCLLELCGLLQQFIREITVANAGYVQLLHKIFLMAVEMISISGKCRSLIKFPHNSVLESTMELVKICENRQRHCC